MFVNIFLLCKHLYYNIDYLHAQLGNQPTILVSELSKYLDL